MAFDPKVFQNNAFQVELLKLVETLKVFKASEKDRIFDGFERREIIFKASEKDRIFDGFERREIIFKANKREKIFERRDC